MMGSGTIIREAAPLRVLLAVAGDAKTLASDFVPESLL